MPKQYKKKKKKELIDNGTREKYEIKAWGRKLKGKEGEGTWKPANQRYRKIATSQTMASYAACMLRVQNDSLFHYRGLRYCIGVPTNCFLPYSFRAADIINTGPPMGNSSVRSHELSASAPQESKWDVSLIDPRENNILL